MDNKRYCSVRLERCDSSIKMEPMEVCSVEIQAEPEECRDDAAAMDWTDELRVAEEVEVGPTVLQPTHPVTGIPKMWNPSVSEVNSDDDDGVVADEQSISVPELLRPGEEFFVVQDDGSLVPMMMPEPDIVTRDDGDDDDDDDVEAAREAVMRAISPVIPRLGSLQPSDSGSPQSQVQAVASCSTGSSGRVYRDGRLVASCSIGGAYRGGGPVASGGGLMARGGGLVASCSTTGGASAAGSGRAYRSGRRGRGGRGCARRGRLYAVSSGESERRSAWSRGERLVQRFASDEELPAPWREDIERLTTERNERAQTSATRGSRAANDEEDSDVENDEVEDEFSDRETFVWTSMNEWNGVKETFLPETSGPTRAYENVYDAFRSYWDHALLSHIVDETNRYAQGIQSEHFQREWFDTNLDEILMLFAFWMMLGVLKMPTVKSCFSKATILRTEIFRLMFIESRYWNLNRAFHLANGSHDVNDPENVLYPMGPVIDQLNLKFRHNYKLHQDICIDESLTLWKGLGGFRQHIKTKSARYGIKTYQLCESSTGYLWSFFVYVGRKTTKSTLSSSASTVVRLMQPLLNLGHVLYMDNWFNSPGLARYLKRRRTDCVGTLRSSRKGVPVHAQAVPLVEGEFVARQSGDVMVVALQDRRRVTCISTFHDVTQVQKKAGHFKLQLIDDYNKNMGGVDRLDQMLEPYLVERKQCAKWTKKLFKRLLNITVQNARILLEQSGNTRIPALNFRLDLVQFILDRHRHNVPSLPNYQPRLRTSYSQFPANRLTERHFIRRIPITDEMRARVRYASNLGRRICVWCTASGRKASKTVYECPQCEVPLCLVSCFEQFHTIP